MGPLHPVDDRRHCHHRERAQARASVKVLDRDYLDLTEPINRGILAFLSALAEDERHRILKQGQRDALRPQSEAHRPPAGRGPQAPGPRRELPGHRQDFRVDHGTIARLAR
jgi:hypothetical protein